MTKLAPKRWYRDPLLQYLLVGLVLAAGYLFVHGVGDQNDDTQRIDVGAAEIQWLHRNWESRWQRPPTESELRGLVNNYVREEVYYRTGVAMGLDRGDDVIRRRVQQKIEMMTEDVAALVQPTEAELQAFLVEHAADYAIPEQRAFTHIYFNLDQRGREGYTAAEALLADLQARPGDVSDAAQLGDRFLLGYRFDLVTPHAVRREFGADFATAMFALDPGGWTGPIESGFGLHLVRIDAVEPGRASTLDEVRAAVQRDLQVAYQQRASDEIYATLAGEFDIVVDESAFAAVPVAPAPTGGSR